MTATFLKRNDKKKFIDYYFSKENGKNCNMLSLTREEQRLYRNAIYVRVNSEKGIILSNFNFEHSFFDDCVLRDIIFSKCNFTDCKFRNCDFKGTYFQDCDFKYSTFQSTFIDDEVLVTSSPRESNLYWKFARNLRVNYHNLGLKKQANVAMQAELNAQATFLKKACFSTEEYYLKKYPWMKRCYKFWELILFYLNYFIWGHGEKIGRCLISMFAILLIFSCYVCVYESNNSNKALLDTFIFIFQYFIGSVDDVDKRLGSWVSTILVVCRIIFSGLFLAALVKKMGK